MGIRKWFGGSGARRKRRKKGKISSPSFWRTAIWALFGISLVAAIADRFRKPNRLFFYSYQGKRANPNDEVGLSVAAVATITPTYFEIENSFPFGDWTTVADATNGKNKWLFFHNRHDGSAATGTIDASYRYKQAKYYPPGTFSDWPYDFVVVNGLGQLLLLGYPPGGGTWIGFGEVLDDGSVVEWWRTKQPFDAPDRNDCTIVGLAKAHAWFKSDVLEGTPAGGTTYVFDVKHARILSSRRTDVAWTGMAVDGDLLYLFNSFDEKSETCVVDDNGQLVPVRPAALDPDLARHRHQCVASTPGAHLGHTYSSSRAFVRVLSRNAFPVTYQVDDLFFFWQQIVRC